MHPSLADRTDCRQTLSLSTRTTPNPALPRLLSRREACGAVATTLRPFKRASEVRHRGAGMPLLRMRVDPRDDQRTLISGSMSDVCDALDALIERQQS